jgi:hypothetical protein
MRVLIPVRQLPELKHGWVEEKNQGRKEEKTNKSI